MILKGKTGDGSLFDTSQVERKQGGQIYFLQLIKLFVKDKDLPR